MAELERDSVSNQSTDRGRGFETGEKGIAHTERERERIGMTKDYTISKMS